MPVVLLQKPLPESCNFFMLPKRYSNLTHYHGLESAVGRLKYERPQKQSLRQ